MEIFKMKNFIKQINWKKFWKYELISFLIVGLLYLNSVVQGRNDFPQNFYIVFLIPAIFAFMMLLKTHTCIIEQKIIKK